MKLSKLIETYKLVNQVEIINERDFDTLGLAVSKMKKTFCTFIDNEKYINSLPENATMLITTKSIASKIKGKGICISKNPRLLFFKIHNLLKNNFMYDRKIFSTVIGKDCEISEFSCIAKKNVIIGDNVVIEEFVSIKENTVINDNSIIRSGSIIGGIGFEFKRDDDEVVPVKHYGGVIINKNVEIQQNNCIDRAIYPWDNTIIEDNCKTDNFVHIAHACKLKEAVFIAASTCVAGRVEIEKGVWIGPGVTIANGIKIGENAKVSIGSVVTQDVYQGETVTGNFAINHNKFIDNLKKIR